MESNETGRDGLERKSGWIRSGWQSVSLKGQDKGTVENISVVRLTDG